MYEYVARRLLATIPVLGVVAVVVFGILHFSPGDPAALIAGDHATVEQVAAMRATSHIVPEPKCGRTAAACSSSFRTPTRRSIRA